MPCWLATRCARFQMMLLLNPGGTSFNCSILASSISLSKKSRSFLIVSIFLFIAEKYQILFSYNAPEIQYCVFSKMAIHLFLKQQLTTFSKPHMHLFQRLHYTKEFLFAVLLFLVTSVHAQTA